MNPRQLTMLSPYRLPTDTTLYMGDEEIGAILNGYAALWHPAALVGAAGLPRLASSSDHDEPAADQVYCQPDNPPLMFAEDWDQRARNAGSVVFTSTADRGETFANLFAALTEAAGEDAERIARLTALPTERIRPFLGIGLGCLVLEALCEA